MYNESKGLIQIVVPNSPTRIKVPNKYISARSYECTPHQRQELDSYRDATGKLHRNTLSHTVTKVEFNTPPMLEADLREFQNLLNMAQINSLERKGVFIFYCFDTGEYEQATCYIPDITFTPLKRLTINGSVKVVMDKTRVAFIEY